MMENERTNVRTPSHFTTSLTRTWSDLFIYHKPLKSERHREEDGGGERDVGRRVQEVGVHQVVEHRVQLEGPRESVRANIMRN